MASPPDLWLPSQRPAELCCPLGAGRGPVHSAHPRIARRPPSAGHACNPRRAQRARAGQGRWPCAPLASHPSCTAVPVLRAARSAGANSRPARTKPTSPRGSQARGPLTWKPLARRHSRLWPRVTAASGPVSRPPLATCHGRPPAESIHVFLRQTWRRFPGLGFRPLHAPSGPEEFGVSWWQRRPPSRAGSGPRRPGRGNEPRADARTAPGAGRQPQRLLEAAAAPRPAAVPASPGTRRRSWLHRGRGPAHEHFLARASLPSTFTSDFIGQAECFLLSKYPVRHAVNRARGGEGDRS